MTTAFRPQSWPTARAVGSKDISGNRRTRLIALPSQLTRSIASLRRAARLLFDRCATAPETRPVRAVSRAHPSRVQRRPTGGEAVIPRPVVRGPMAVAFPRSRSPVPPPRPFWECHSRLCRLSTGGVGVPSSARNGARSGRWSPLPPLHPRRRSNSDHAGKSSYSGEIDYRLLTFQTGSRI